MRFLLSASVAVVSLISFDVYAQTCQKAPDCATLGYTENASQCSGRKYTVCPFDTTRYSCDTTTCADLGYEDDIAECPGEYDVCQYDKTKGKCIYEARPGDLKYSWQVKNHNGWLLCNGQYFSETQFPELYAVINRLYVPNYKNYYLRGAAETSIAKFGGSKPQTLPNITGRVYSIMTGGSNTSVGALYQTFGENTSANNSGRDTVWRNIYIDANKSNETYGRPDEEKGETTKGSGTYVNPPHYLANIFIFAGKNKMPKATDTDITGKYVYSDGSTSTSYDSSKTLLGYGNTSNIYMWGGNQTITANSYNSALQAASERCQEQGGNVMPHYNYWTGPFGMSSNSVMSAVSQNGKYYLSPSSSSPVVITGAATASYLAFDSSKVYYYYCFSYYTPVDSQIHK